MINPHKKLMLVLSLRQKRSGSTQYHTKEYEFVYPLKKTSHITPFFE